MQQARPPRLIPALPIVPYEAPAPAKRVRRRDRAKRGLTKAMRMLRDRVLGQRKPEGQSHTGLAVYPLPRVTAPVPHGRMQEVLERDRALIKAHSYVAQLEEQRSQSLRAARRSAFGLRPNQSAMYRLSMEGWTPTLLPQASTEPELPAHVSPPPTAGQEGSTPDESRTTPRITAEELRALEALPFIEMEMDLLLDLEDAGEPARPANAGHGTLEDGDRPSPAPMDMLEDEDEDNRPPVPIRTRTMARLLASQGKSVPALEIYGELIAQHPDDRDLAEEAQALRDRAPIPARLAEEPEEPRSSPTCDGSTVQGLSAKQ